MKKILFLIIILCSFASISSADEQRKIKLSDSHSKEMIRFAICNIFVEVANKNDEYVNVSLTLENVDETNSIFLFGHSFPEKELKRLTPSITFDKQFPGTKGRRQLDTYQGAKSVVYIQPSDKSFIQELQIFTGKEAVQKYRLPLYIAKYKGKKRNKLILLEEQVIELEIEYEQQKEEDDMDIIRLNDDYDLLLKDLSDVTFCPNRRHKPALEKQVEPYKERLERILTEADSIIKVHRWKTTDKGYEPYKLLKERMDSLDFTQLEKDCGNHVSAPVSTARGHKCKYCGLSLQEIYNKLDDYYIKIYNSNDRKEVKAAVIGEVNMLYRCCTDGNCRNHSAVWKNSEFKSKIIDRYNRINNF